MLTIPPSFLSATVGSHAFSSHTSADALSMVSAGTPSIKGIAVPLALSIARGGAELFRSKATGLDIGRVRMRLEGLQAYATLCALLTNGCLRLYSSVREPKEQVTKSKEIALDAFLLCVVVSILFGSYTTIVFGLLSLYSKTALGRGYDAQFLEFWSATADIRESGFESFIYSLVSFEMAFILSLFLRFEGRRRKMLVVIACIISILSFTRWSMIMHLAGTLLFPLRAEVAY
jgi:hypothetical protein